jgi:uncharacterized membrane protein
MFNQSNSSLLSAPVNKPTNFTKLESADRLKEQIVKDLEKLFITRASEFVPVNSILVAIIIFLTVIVTIRFLLIVPLLAKKTCGYALAMITLASFVAASLAFWLFFYLCKHF